MDTERLRETLQDTGLTQYEAEAYIALLELGSAAATEVASACDVPQARIYDVLRNLEGRGYIETYEEESLHARAHDPSEVIADLDAYADTIADASGEIRARWERPTVENHRVSVVKPLSAIFDRAEEAIDDAETELRATMNLEQFLRFRKRLAAAHDRGVVVKLTLTPTEEANPDPENLGIDFTGTATEVRYRRLPTPFIVIADHAQIRFAPERTLHRAHEYGIMVNDYSLSRIFAFFFQLAVWETWPTVYSARGEEPPFVYTSIRECIATIEPYVSAGADVVLTVEGQRMSDNTSRTMTGRVVDLEWVRGGDGYAPLERFTNEATIKLDVDGEEYSVGGWGALLEDIEGGRFVVESVA